MFIMPVEPVSIDLERERQRLAMEASVLSNVIETFRTMLPSVTNKLSDIVTSFKPVDDLTKTINDLNKFTESHKKEISEVGIVKHSDTLIQVPEGFDSTAKMIPYLNFLLSNTPVLMEKAQEILSEYHLVLSTFISNKDAKKAIRDHSAFYKRIEKARLGITGPLESYFDKESFNSRQKFGKVYDQTSDVFDAVKLVTEINRYRAKQNLEAFRSQVKDCVDLLNVVIRQSETGDLSEVSGVAAMDLSDGALEVAMWAELIAVFQYRVEQAVNAVKIQVETISKLK